MSETRRRFDDEFKKNAVRLSYASNKPVAEVARDLDISDAIVITSYSIHYTKLYENFELNRLTWSLCRRGFCRHGRTARRASARQ